MALFLTTFSPLLQNASAQTPPSTMNFQGRLLSSSGTLLPDGLYNMQFGIYSASTGGSALWSETRQTSSRVQVTNGLFTVQLGEVTPLPASLFNTTNLYFQITMPTPATATCNTTACASWESPMTPRNKLATSAYAFNAAMLNGKTDTDFAAATGGTGYIQNTTSPQTANFSITGTGTVSGLTATTTVSTPIIRPIANSTTALRIQNAAGTTTIMTVDSTSNRVGVGTAVPTSQFTVTQPGQGSAHGLAVTEGSTERIKLYTSTGNNTYLDMDNANVHIRNNHANGYLNVVSARSISFNTTNGTLGGYNFALSSTNVTTISATGELLHKDPSNSANSFQVQNSSSVAQLTVDTANSRVQVGSNTTDSNVVYFMLDQYNQAADPANTVNGAMYYNTNTNKFRCYQGGEWSDCVTAPGANTSLSNLSSTNINTALNRTGGDLTLQTTTSGNVVINPVGTIQLQKATTVTGNFNATGTVSGSNLSGSNTGDVTLSGQNYLSLAGQAITANAINLGTHTTGTLGLGSGGTGATTAQGAINAISGLSASGDLLYHNGSNATRLARGTSGQCLTTAGTALQWGSCGLGAEADTLASVTARGATTATAATFSGGLTASGSGTGLSVTNNATIGGTLGVTGAISGSNLSGSNTGDVGLSGQNYITISGQTITANAINLGGSHTTGTLGLSNGGTNATTAQGAINNISGLTTNGDLLYHNGTNSTRLARGTNGQCLATIGTTLQWGSCGISSEADTLASVTARGATTATAATFSGGLTASGSGTGLSVTNNATIGGTLSITGAASIQGSSALTFGGDASLSRTAANVLSLGASDIFRLESTSYLATESTNFATAGSVNNASLGGSYIRLTGSSAQTLTGIAGGANGRQMIITNAGANDATLVNESGSSTAANRIVTGTGNNLTIASGASVSLIYDSSSSRWRVAGSAAGNYVALQSETPGSAQTGNINITGTMIAATFQGTSLNISSNATIGGTLSVTGAISGSNLSGTNTGNVTLSGQNYLSLAGQAITANAINLGSHTTGTLGLGSGGTGATTAQGAINAISGLTTNGDLLYHNGTNSTRLARGANGNCLTSTSSSIQWGSCGVAGANTSLSNLASTNINTALNRTSGDLTLQTTTSGNIILNPVGTIALQKATTVTGNFSTSGSISLTGASGSILATTGGANLTIDAGTTGEVRIAGTSTGNVLLGGGFGSTGCTVYNNTGGFTCNGQVAGSQLVSTTPTGTAPLSVNSTTKVALLNADAIDGLDSTAFGQLSANNTWTGTNTVSVTNSAAFRVQSASGSDMLSVDTNGGNVTVGTITSKDVFTKLTNPASQPAGIGDGVAFSPDGQYMSVAHQTTPFITIYKRSGDVFNKLPNPVDLPAGAGYDVAFSPDGQYMTVAHQVTPFITIYKRDGDTFNKLANPADLPTAQAVGVAFSSGSQYMTVSQSTSPNILIYKRDGDTFTKLPNPSTMPVGGTEQVAFSPDGQYMTVPHVDSPFITIYKRSGDTFIKLPNPDDLPAGRGMNVAFSPDGQYMSVAHLVTPFVTIYKRSGDTFTKLTNPIDLPASNGRAVSFSADGKHLSVSHDSNPYVTIYKRTGDTFAKIANPATLPPSTSFANAFSPDGQYLAVAHGNPPYVTIYKQGGTGMAVNGVTALNGATTVSGNLTVTSDTQFAGGAVLLGQVGSSSGLLSFANAANANIVSVVSGVTTSSYTLTLPSSVGGAGQCLVDTNGGGALGWANCGTGTKLVTLTPEYHGGVLKADGSNNNGTMTSDFVDGLAAGSGYKHTFYDWSTSQATAQDYDIVVTHQLPNDFNASTEFDNSSWKVWTYVDHVANSGIAMTVYDSDGTVCANGVNIKGGSTGWSQITLADFDTNADCDFVAASVITIRIKLSSTAPSTNHVRVAGIEYRYTP